MSGSHALTENACIEPLSVPLFQFWDKKIPPAVAALTKGVESMNASVEYLFFTDSSAAEFIRQCYGSETLKLYRNCLIPAMRADLFRYCYLARHGGFYIDADFKAVSSVEPILNKGWQGCLYLRERGLTNSMMYFSTPYHPLAERILELALDNITIRSSSNVWQVTGPFVLQSIQSNDANKSLFDDIHLMDEQEFALYFKLAPHLDYKLDDSHWLVARQKGLDIFRD